MEAKAAVMKAAVEAAKAQADSEQEEVGEGHRGREMVVVKEAAVTAPPEGVGKGVEAEVIATAVVVQAEGTEVELVADMPPLSALCRSRM